jgi:hypothetical protein
MILQNAESREGEAPAEPFSYDRPANLLPDAVSRISDPQKNAPEQISGAIN